MLGANEIRDVEVIFLQTVVLSERWMAGMGQARQTARPQNEAGPLERAVILSSRGARADLDSQLPFMLSPLLECPSPFAKLLLIFKNPVQTTFLFMGVFSVNLSIFPVLLAFCTHLS